MQEINDFTNQDAIEGAASLSETEAQTVEKVKVSGRDDRSVL